MGSEGVYANDYGLFYVGRPENNQAVLVDSK